MACPYCKEPEEETTGELRLHEASLDGCSVDFRMHCNYCGEEFWQRFYAKFDDYNYDNIKDERDEEEKKRYDVHIDLKIKDLKIEAEPGDNLEELAFAKLLKLAGYDDEEASVEEITSKLYDIKIKEE